MTSTLIQSFLGNKASLALYDLEDDEIIRIVRQHRARPVLRKIEVAIVTGASSGIGLVLAKKLITARYSVVANARNIMSAGTLRTTDDFRLVDGDVATQKSAERVVGTAIQEFGRVDLLVNNAGLFIPKPFTGVARTAEVAADRERLVKPTLELVRSVAVGQRRF